ncbi:hypothetical protein H5410_005335 [Solanum commersonii]|uniref:Uncharacterized protein n=1 Tax=Solanum commersonii TaxID=4109 RepID=A0A9J6A6C6_SOLCO|nr:hypothetical protein H5410_005335 [Solanum commersonii]
MLKGVFPHILRTPCAHGIVVEYDEEIHKAKKFGKTRQDKIRNDFLTLYSFYKQKKNLRTLFMSTKWNESTYSKETLGKEVARHIISPFFWNDVVQALRVGGPLIHVLRMVDGEKKPPMGYIYEAMDEGQRKY